MTVSVLGSIGGVGLWAGSGLPVELGAAAAIRVSGSGLATGIAALVVVGNVSFPVMVLAGVVEFDPDAGTHIAVEHQEEGS